MLVAEEQVDGTWGGDLVIPPLFPLFLLFHHDTTRLRVERLISYNDSSPTSCIKETSPSIFDTKDNFLETCILVLKFRLILRFYYRRNEKFK